ncbi:unnamed protein product [Pieris macdunnoughi]|uniref:Uncharacterized protein n=1 Tax=Pieris macdunnoughi TaxID=345717 RepID=A0A821VIK5_9NEOP|nr:unnamed protein product [Pieris macdunnoughi]
MGLFALLYSTAELERVKPAHKMWLQSIGLKLARSNQSQVVLTRVSFGLSGNFSCEVTADAPSFATSIVSNTMDVVVLPASSPMIHTSQHYYMPGDILRGNCSSGPSRPPAELTFFINDIPVTPGLHNSQTASDGLFFSELFVQVHLWPAHYERGAPILRCEAKVADLYRENSAVALYSANSDPKIERVDHAAGNAIRLIEGSLRLCYGLRGHLQRQFPLGHSESLFSLVMRLIGL